MLIRCSLHIRVKPHAQLSRMWLSDRTTRFTLVHIIFAASSIRHAKKSIFSREQKRQIKSSYRNSESAVSFLCTKTAVALDSCIFCNPNSKILYNFSFYSVCVVSLSQQVRGHVLFFYFYLCLCNCLYLCFAWSMASREGRLGM